jgi:xanthine dehydrogenase accessory factor
MTELQSVMAAARSLRGKNQPLLLATVVAVRGSSYRRPGARLLIAGDRWITGSVSGGCLEGDLVRRGWWRTEATGATVVSYDSTGDEEDAGWGIGLGCNGVVDILLERVEPGSAAVDCLFDVAERIRSCALVTIFESTLPQLPVGSRVVVERNGSFTAASTVAGEDAARVIVSLVRQARNLFEDSTSTCTRHFSGTITVGAGASTVRALVELIAPPPALFVCGGGRDAVPVVTMARLMGWDVSVYEPRRRESLVERFKDAHRIISGDPGKLRQAVDAAACPLTVVMSHDYQIDSQILRALLPSRAAYVGVLGPRRRTDKILEALRADGMALPPELSQRLYSPIGLAIGAETPEEIALAIISEAQAALASERAGFLRDRVGSVHLAKPPAAADQLALEAAE